MTSFQRLDIPSNPVAIIACSVILGLYIVLMIVCKKLDIMDVQRISTIPLCGKDGSFKYEVTMVTGRQVGAGEIFKPFTIKILSIWVDTADPDQRSHPGSAVGSAS